MFESSQHGGCGPHNAEEVKWGLSRPQTACPQSEMRRESVGKVLTRLGSAMVVVGRLGEAALTGFMREAARWRPNDAVVVVAAGLAALTVMVILTATLYIWLPVGLLIRVAGQRLAGENRQLGYRFVPVPNWRWEKGGEVR